MKTLCMAVWCGCLLAAPASAQFVVNSATGTLDWFNPGSDGSTPASNPAGFSESCPQGTMSFSRAQNRLILASAVWGDRSPGIFIYGAADIRATFTTSSGQYLRRIETLNQSGSGHTHYARVVNASNGTVIPADGYLPPGQYRAETGLDSGTGSLSLDYRVVLSQANTLCDHAQDVGNGTFTGTTQDAIPSGGQAGSCGSSAESPAVWYRYTAPRAGTVNISTCGSSYDTVLAVFAATSCPAAPQQVACNDDAGGAGCGGLDSRVSVAVVQGGIYYIRVSGYNGASGAYVLHIGPDNDLCAYATPIAPATGLIPFDTTFASTDGAPLPGGACSNGGADPQVNNEVWLRFDPPVNGYFALTTCDQASWDTKIAVYEGEACQGEGEYAGCSDDSCGLQSAVGGAAWRGTPLYFRVGGYLAARGAGALNFTWEVCRIDFNNDGFVDFFDYNEYVECYETGNCVRGATADYNGDGFADFFDYNDYVADFEAFNC